MSKATGFDLDALEQTDTATIQLVDPRTGDEIGASVTVYGQDSEICREQSHKLSDRCADYSRRNQGKTIPNKEYARLDKMKVIACVKSIDGLTSGGQPFTDVAAIFDRFQWIHEQTVAGLVNRTLFIKGSPAK